MTRIKIFRIEIQVRGLRIKRCLFSKYRFIRKMKLLSSLVLSSRITNQNYLYKYSRPLKKTLKILGCTIMCMAEIKKNWYLVIHGRQV